MSYSDLLQHESMVFDEVRNRAYLEAMKRVITPESVVLDLGAGVGVLGLLAAKAGAKKVYCVEPSPVAAHIPTLAQANGVGDRVVALRGRIEDVELPEQVDVLVSVFTGNLLFTECLLAPLYYARDRYLKPGGAMIPDLARLSFAGAEAPQRHAETVGRYRRESLGIDYSTIAASLANGFVKLAREDSVSSQITSPIVATELDLRSTCDDRIQWKGSVEALRDGTVHGLLGWIELRLGDTWLSTAPDQPEVHWQPMLLPVASPVPVRQGQQLELAFQFVDDAQVFWSVSTEQGTQRQSPLRGNVDAAVNMILASPACVLPLGPEGELVEQALAAMRQGKSNQVIASELREAMPKRFRDERHALKRVGLLAAAYRAHPARKT